MVIHTPHIELAHRPPGEMLSGIPQVQERHTQECETESPQKTKQDNELSVFARILAGLSGRRMPEQDTATKTGTGEQDSETEVPVEVSLAENAEAGNIQPALRNIESIQAEKTAFAAKTDSAVNGTTVVGTAIADTTVVTEKIGLNQPEKTGETEPELIHFGLSQQENNAALERLIGQSDQQTTGEMPVSERAADKLTNNRQGAETLTTQLSHGETTVETETQAVNLSAASHEKPQKTGEKVQNRAAETHAAARHNATEAAQGAGSRQIEASKIAKHEGEGRNRLDETRNRRRGVNFEVRDLRSASVQSEAALRDGSAQLRVGAENRLSLDGTSKEITLELRLPNQGQDTSLATSSWEVKAGQAFEDILARELHQNFNNDIVRHASVMLKDGNQGIIKLALKPESLGNVKIRLEMAENKITGIIIVESEEALRAFQREIASLEKAFLDSGFDGADLGMSLAADGREAQQQWQNMETHRTLPWHYAATRYDEAAERMETPMLLDLYWQGTRAINVLV